MATYLELRNLYNNADLLNKIEVAVIVAAHAINEEDAGTANHANRLLWAKNAVAQTRSVAERMLMILLADNKDSSVAQITGASDAVIQNAVTGAVNLFADGS